MVRPLSTQYAICPLEDCPVAHEAEYGETYFCPSCNVEMITQCPKCETRVTQEEQTHCSHCGLDLKE